MNFSNAKYELYIVGNAYKDIKDVIDYIIDTLKCPTYKIWREYFRGCIYWYNELISPSFADLQREGSKGCRKTGIASGEYIYDMDDSGQFWFKEYSDENNNVKGFIITDIRLAPYKFIDKYQIVESKQLSELAEFQSWMHRLDEVKGARPTFWIEG